MGWGGGDVWMPAAEEEEGLDGWLLQLDEV